MECQGIYRLEAWQKRTTALTMQQSGSCSGFSDTGRNAEAGRVTLEDREGLSSELPILSFQCLNVLFIEGEIGYG